MKLNPIVMTGIHRVILVVSLYLVPCNGQGAFADKETCNIHFKPLYDWRVRRSATNENFTTYVSLSAIKRKGYQVMPYDDQGDYWGLRPGLGDVVVVIAAKDSVESELDRICIQRGLGNRESIQFNEPSRSGSRAGERSERGYIARNPIWPAIWSDYEALIFRRITANDSNIIESNSGTELRYLTGFTFQAGVFFGRYDREAFSNLLTSKIPECRFLQGL